MLERGGGVVGDLDAGREPVEDAVAAQHGVALRRDQHAGLRVAEDVVLLQYALKTVTYYTLLLGLAIMIF